ncbi:MAG: hypothetical protein ACRC1Z_23245 [Waterburya sp.]
MNRKLAHGKTISVRGLRSLSAIISFSPLAWASVAIFKRAIARRNTSALELLLFVSYW